MLSVKAREAANTIFKVFGMTQLRIKPIASLHDQNKSGFFGGPAFIQPIRAL